MTTNREAFDAIASTWYGVRHWPLLRHELEGLAQRWGHGRIANLGCGTGADFLPLASDFELVGVDCSRGMLREAQRHQTKHNYRATLIQGDLASLPLGDSAFDYAVGIAAYHLVKDETARLLAFRELRRILRPAGEAFLSVWNHEQPRFHSLPQDQSIPWRIGKVVVERNYHLYTRDELESELRRSGFDVVQLRYGTMRTDSSKEDSRNICALIRKPAT
jgi:tRNA (uracil-5-)-methyltransferase TRM9